ncbi:MAG: adenylate/guanylate cyclase domain-containing protein [Gaiellaceae bacterium]
MTRAQLIPLAALLALPLAGLALLLARPATDVHWEHQPSHFWLVVVTAGLNAALAYATGMAARRRGDRRVHLVSLAFLAASGFLALHALATPGVLLEGSNLGFVIATPVGLVVAGAFAAASALEADLLRPAQLERLLLAALLIWAIVSLTLLPELRPTEVPGRLSWPLVTLAAIGIGLYSLAIVRYLAVYRTRSSGLLLGFVVAFVLLAEALVAVAIGRSWQASWWEWHVLMLAAFGLIALTAHREWHVERFSGLYSDETAESSRQVTVLFADLQGFTSYSERHEPGQVTEMLNTLFKAAIPAVERNGGEIDRLIGDAIMATFNRGGDQEDHAERAARAALDLQRSVTALAASHPDWPRFRAGLNSGEASVGVLGSGGGRTYSVIGDTVNLAARIEGLPPPGGVAVSGGTASRLSGATTQPLGDVEVKGREAPVDVHLLLSLPGWDSSLAGAAEDPRAVR